MMKMIFSIMPSALQSWFLQNYAPAFLRAKSETSAIGINQYSNDMGAIYEYLTSAGGEKFVAGDYKGFDKRHQKEFRDRAYALLFKLADWVKSNKIHEYLLEHETNSDAQLGSYKFHTISNHMSGCFFTTIVNCLVNEAYLRYCFLKMNPTRIFDKCIRLKVLGDDHVVYVNEGVELSGRQIKTEMVKIGQHYTSDDKSEDPGDYRSFDQITFLGAHPVKRRGIYTGAIKKSTLYQAIQWTRDDDKSTAITATTMMELSSQWGPEYYENYCSDVVNAFENSGFSITRKKHGQILICDSSSTNSGKMAIFQAVGDDFVYGLFRPPLKVVAKIVEIDSGITFGDSHSVEGFSMKGTPE